MAIAWVADEDYKKAGFKLLPVQGKKDLKTAFQIMTYTLFLIPLGLLPTYFGLTGINSAVIVTVCGVLFLASTIKLMQDQSRESALRIMFSSFLYLPVVQTGVLTRHGEMMVEDYKLVDSPVEQPLSMHPKKFAMLLFIATAIMIFAAFTSAHIVRQADGKLVGV